MIRELFTTDNNTAGLIIRLTMGLVMLPHGVQKLLGGFGGYGFTGTMRYFTGTLQMNAVLAFLVIMIEFFGSTFLIAGFATRITAGLMIALMIGILAKSPHLKNGFFMNWSGQQAGEGFEYHLLFLGLAIALLFTGAGKFSADGLIAR